MILPVLVWLFQDIIQVIFMGIFLVPEIFLLALIFASLQPENERGHDFGWYIAVAFAGGLLWDFRWTNTPGITAALNGVLLAIIFTVWRLLSAQGRNDKTFAACALGAQFVSAIIHAMLWTVSSSVAIRLFAIQQLFGIVLVIVLSFAYKKAIYRHV